MPPTPGLLFLSRFLVIIAIPGVSTIALRHICNNFNVTLPSWISVLIAVFTVPTVVTARILLKELKDRRGAASMGARMIPRAQGAWLGNLDVLRAMKKYWQEGYPGDGLWELMEKHGPVINLRILWEDLVFTASPEHIKLILATDFNNYVKGERFHHSMGSVLGTGVFNSDGDMWKFHRSITRPVFTRDRITHFDLFDRHAESVTNHIKQRMREGCAIDFQDLMSRFTLDSATEFLFGTCVHSLSAGIPYPHNITFALPDSASPHATRANEFAQAFLEAQEMIADRERTGWVWPLLEIFRERTKKPMKVVNAYIEPIIQEALEKKRLAGPNSAEKHANSEVGDDETLLDHLVSLTSDPKVIRDETLNIMIAGRDTTAATMTFIIYLLSRYPAVMARLREEILSKVGGSRRPDYEDIREMKYLRAVINETLRLYPIVPFNTRETIHATTWPSAHPGEKPLYIPAGTKTAYSVFMMHRRKDLWGPDAEEFDPDRFLDERLKKYLVSNSFIFLPFNAGPRICLGQQFAYNEISFMLIRLLQNFSSVDMDLDAAPPEFRPPAEWASTAGRKATEKVFPKMHLTMYSGGGLWVKFHEASGQ
ncbi:cytochrome P450 monooxygenase pc-1 [Infundibulicybe gibba]|nr:cytochrome P450 monooxygenase pc-1 [Infundibulicybe gibba]